MEPRRPPITRKEFIPKQFKRFSSSLQTKDPELYADIMENPRLIREMGSATQVMLASKHDFVSI